MSELLQPAVLIGIITGTIRFATPYLYASIGEMFAQRSGVVNLGVRACAESRASVSRGSPCDP